MAALRHLAAGPTCHHHHHHGVAAATASLRLHRLPLPFRPLRSRSGSFTRVYAISSNDIRVGTNVEVDGAPWKVLGDKTAFLSLPSFIRRLFIHPRLLKDMQHCTSISFMDTTHLVFIEKQKLRRCAKCTSLLCKICRLTSLHPTTEFLHVKPGKGAAFVRTKLRNYVTGNTVEKTFRAGSTLQEPSLSKETKQFTYKDGSQFVFMDLTTFEESRLNEADVGDKQKWLKEGMDCNLLYWNGKIIDFDLPITVRLTVTDTDPGASDSAQGGTKPATLETGAVVTVPSFVNVGDDILVDSRTGQYMNRA
ncbi:Elongation factor P [Zea mays]|uniref:Elongation factor P n=1 Tax=Zea mays TaxID=4577 RepID=A0A1D6ISX4_MAIZE|nr:Elongation factor P [Zea mays]